MAMQSIFRRRASSSKLSTDRSQSSEWSVWNVENRLEPLHAKGPAPKGSAPGCCNVRTAFGTGNAVGATCDPRLQFGANELDNALVGPREMSS